MLKQLNGGIKDSCCNAGSNATAPSPAACNVSYAELTLAPTRICATSSSANFTLRCPACASALSALPPPPAAAAEVPLCNGTQRLTGASGVFTDGAPPGGLYAPGSFCQWVIDPGYKCVRGHHIVHLYLVRSYFDICSNPCERMIPLLELLGLCRKRPTCHLLCIARYVLNDPTEKLCLVSDAMQGNCMLGTTVSIDCTVLSK